MAVQKGQLYPLGDRYPGRERQQNLRVQATGEFRPPLKGEWFLSGAIVEAYQAHHDHIAMQYHIAVIVRVTIRTIETIVEVL